MASGSAMLSKHEIGQNISEHPSQLRVFGYQLRTHSIGRFKIHSIHVVVDSDRLPEQFEP